MYSARIRKVETGEIRVCQMDIPWLSDDGSLFWWRDGNFGCDCNREMEFLRANGEPIPEEAACGYSRFQVLDVTLDDGRTLVVDEVSNE